MKKNLDITKPRYSDHCCQSLGLLLHRGSTVVESSPSSLPPLCRYTRFSVRVEIESRVTGQMLLCTGNARKKKRDLANNDLSFIVILFSFCLFRAGAI